MFDVTIIGAGVIGAMAARELSRYQLSVCILEKENDVAMGTSKANSGILHGGHDPVPGTLKARLNREGLGLVYRAAEELHVPCRNNGSFVCAFGSEQEERCLELLLARGQQNGIANLEILDGETARKMEPGLSPGVSRVLHIPDSGIICPYELTIAAVGNAMDNGVKLVRNFKVESITYKDAFIVHGDHGEAITSRYLLNCAGGYADQIARMVGEDFFTIIPRAGEYMLLDKTEGCAVSKTIFQVPTQAGKGILVTPTVDGNLLVGPTAQKVDTPNNTETTAAGLEHVAKLAAKSVPQISFKQVITAFSGVRASTEGKDFIIQPSRVCSKLIHVAAIDSPGLTCCVSAARYAISLLEKQGLLLNKKKEWNAERRDFHAFRTMSESEKNQFIKNNPAYGKIVCRCENVTEGEILDALRINPPALDVDGVKRRTRAGMGRCQGGFCSPQVIRLIARNHNISMCEVTKCGPGSEYFPGFIQGEISHEKL